MTMLTTVGGVAALLAAGGTLLRRRISRNWISPSSMARLDDRRFTNEQTIIITGGNAGLGYEAAKDLAGRGARIVLACRDEEAGRRAASRITENTGNGDVECAGLDLASLDSVRAFAAELKARDENIHALVCNAGVWVPSESSSDKKTRDGFEIHFGVNHLGHFALIQSLLPQMMMGERQQSGMGKSRIIIVSSSLCKSGKINLQKSDFVHGQRVPGSDERNSFAPTGYCDSKLMNMLTCRELATRLRGSNVATYAVSPGFCSSRLGRNVHMPIYKKMLAAPLMRLFQRSSEQGALNIVFAVTEDEASLESGAMYQDGKIWEDGLKLIEGLEDDALQKGLWDLSEKLTKDENVR